jgi:ribosomal protein L37E
MTHQQCVRCGSKIAYKKKNGMVKCYVCGFEWKEKNSLDYFREGLL